MTRKPFGTLCRVVVGFTFVLALGVVLVSCGGGGGGGPTPPPTTDVGDLYPLTQNRTWEMDYTETEHTYLKMTGEMIRMEVGRSRIGPFTFSLVLPKIVPGHKTRATHTYEQTRDETTQGIDTYEIIGRMTSPFPVEVAIQEDSLSAQWTEAITEKLDGQVVNQESDSGSFSEKSRSFFTNENGEFKWWGTQEYDEETGTWGEIEVFPEPLLMFKGGVTSWTVGHIEESMDIGGEEVEFSGDIVARLVGEETVTVPAGTFKCYKVVYTLSNVRVTWPSGIQVTSWRFDMTMTAWLALDVGMVKSENKTTLNASFRDLETGATGSVSHSNTSTSRLKSR